MTTMVWVYLGYLIVCVLVTVFVARTLRIHGPVYMAERSSDTSPLVKAKTHLMVVGFYLITFGTVGFALRYGGDASDAKTAIELLSTKLGGVIFAIGFFHFVMVGLFANAGGKNHRRDVVLAKPVKLPEV
ncbi:MAG: hypothetical protein AB8B55_23315 [Mariniblastus sp.]